MKTLGDTLNKRPQFFRKGTVELDVNWNVDPRSNIERIASNAALLQKKTTYSLIGSRRQSAKPWYNWVHEHKAESLPRNDNPELFHGVA